VVILFKLSACLTKVAGNSLVGDDKDGGSVSLYNAGLTAVIPDPLQQHRRYRAVLRVQSRDLLGTQTTGVEPQPAVSIRTTYIMSVSIDITITWPTTPRAVCSAQEAVRAVQGSFLAYLRFLLRPSSSQEWASASSRIISCAPKPVSRSKVRTSGNSVTTDNMQQQAGTKTC